MQLHTLSRQHPNKDKKRVGRGGKRGKTSGRGHKGQNSRAGAKKRPEERDMIKKLPKLRGRGKNKNTSIVDKPVAINLSVLEETFAAKETVSVSSLKAKGLMRKTDKSAKILGTGTLSKSLTIDKIPASVKAQEAIKSAGGTIA